MPSREHDHSLTHASRVAAQAGVPRAHRTKILIVNMLEVYGIDTTAADVFAKLVRLANANGIQLVFAALSNHPSTARWYTVITTQSHAAGLRRAVGLGRATAEQPGHGGRAALRRP